MASTTFSGPIKAGTIANTTGTTLGDDVKNVGQVVMTQSWMLINPRHQQKLNYIPANSQIVGVNISNCLAAAKQQAW